MVGRLLAKLGVASSTISGVVYFDVVPTSSILVRSKEEFKELTGDFKTIEDIELFERLYGCNFVFVNNWDNKDLYSARAFDEKKKEKDWTQAILTVLNKKGNNKEDAKAFCKKQQGVITLFDNQKDKVFRLGEPDNKQW